MNELIANFNTTYVTVSHRRSTVKRTTSAYFNTTYVTVSRKEVEQQA